MSHREQHFAGLHFAKANQIGAVFDDEQRHNHDKNSPNSPSLAQLESLRLRVYSHMPNDDNKHEDEKPPQRTIDEIIAYLNEAQKAQTDLAIAKKHGFSYFYFQTCSNCGSSMEQVVEEYGKFAFPVWFCPRCHRYYTVNFDGVAGCTYYGYPIRTQEMMVHECYLVRK